jgi:cell division septum initiation protein DivIVA
MKRMDIDALRQAHEKLKRKSQRQRDRIKELEEGIRDYGIEVSGRKILLASNVFKRLCKLLTPTKDR